MRPQDWIDRMWSTLEAARDRPFEYGHCARLAAECVDEISGTAFRPDVEQLVAAAADSPVTLEQLEAFVTARLGAPLPTILQACQGDVILLELPAGPALGICVGHQIACAGALGGVVYLKLERALKAWRTP